MVPRKREGLLLTDWTWEADDETFSEIVCELAAFPGWRILPDVAATDQGLVLRRLVIEPADGLPDGGITGRMLRELRTGELIAALRAAARQASQIPGIEPDLSVGRRSGRTGRPLAYYAQWAQAYTDALGSSRRPVADLAARHGLDHAQVRNLISRCRDKGMLTRPPDGRAGGTLTDKARRLLDELDR